jgi:adenine/guanine phosphoribosyltransferase-like PRPP-binding protein
VNNEEIWQILRNGGLDVERSDDEADAGYRIVGSFRPLSDMLAERARELEPDIVIVGEGAKDLLLGFVVARELGRPLVRCLNLEGLVGAVGDIPEGSKAIFVADKIRKSGFVYAVGNLVDREGGELVGVVSWIYADAPELAVPWIGLVKPEEGLQQS